MPEKLGGDFGFEVGYEDLPAGRWILVQLPHQCNEWLVACTKDKTEAIKRTERFIAEAQIALARLRALPDSPHFDEDGDRCASPA